ncbi:Clavaminate synthase-like protein [Hypomontagnella monticulosa]|nr:Clavaminate synthase-like protein [Hypomontagnella monticulosa]
MSPIEGISRSLLSSKSLYATSGVYRFSRLISQYVTKSPRELPTLRRNGAFKQVPSSQARKLSTSRNTLTRQEFKSLGYKSLKPDTLDQAGAQDPEIRLVGPDEITIGLRYKDRKGPIFLPRHWLRDACECNICVDPDSGQKNFGTCDVPTNPPIKAINSTTDGGLEIVWERDFLTSGEHVSRYSRKDLDPQYVPGSTRPKRNSRLPRITLWDAAMLERDRLTIDFNDWMAGGEEFLSGLLRLHTHGLLFLRNIPPSEESVVSIANQIGDIQETFYGRTWDVRSKPRAENVAYTSSFLGLHQDLLYMEDPPGIQLLHCLENTCEGGESMFSDGARVANILRYSSQKEYADLRRRHFRYHYTKQGNDREMLRPVIPNEPNIVYWSPPFQASKQVVDEALPVHHEYFSELRSLALFRELLEGKQWMYQYKMQPGECVLFHNLRILHGRRQFDSQSGSRWLKGTYVSRDVFEDKLHTLMPQLMALGTSNETLRLSDQATKLRRRHGLWIKKERTAPLSEKASTPEQPIVEQPAFEQGETRV